MTYVAWVSTEGGGPPSGGLTWYFGDHPAGGTMPGSSNPATVARDDFVARLAETITWEDWEGEGPYGPWEAGTSLDGVEIVRNGVTADFAGTASAVVSGENSGRFNVDPPGFISELFCETQLRNETGDVREFVMNFAPPIVAWGAFLTDLGDFATVNRLYGEVTGAVPPARAPVQVAALPRGAVVEIDAIAFAGAR